MALEELVHKRLKQVARSGQIIHYADLAPVAGLNMASKDDRAELGRILGEISTREHAEGHPMLSVVVVQAGTGRPSRGFFDLARQLGLHQGKDDFSFFVEELRKVYAFWGR